MGKSTQHEQLIEALSEGATVVTGNARLARDLYLAHAERRHADGDTVWPRPKVLSWTAWLARCYGDALAAGAIHADEPAVLLSDTQAERLWQQVIEEQSQNRAPLLRPDAAARQACRTHRLCLDWRISPADVEQAYPQSDGKAFLNWWHRFNAELKAGGWLLPGEVPARLPRWMERLPALRPDTLWLAGFTELTPRQETTMKALAEHGVNVRSLTGPAGPGGQATQHPCPDADAEGRAAAAWARDGLRDDPTARLGIVVPDLSERKSLVTRCLAETLDPPATRRIGRQRRHPWNISLGDPLAEEPAVHTALLVLEAASGQLAFNEASSLLRSPFLGGAVRERAARMHAEVALRDSGDAEVRTDWLIRQLGEAANASGRLRCPDLAQRLDAVRNAHERAPRQQRLEDWAGYFAAVLKHAGWPGERVLDSHEYQVAARWHALLGELASFAVVEPECREATALMHLRRLARDTVFQPESAPAPVQVLGLFEAIGQRFDGLWVMGLDDETWPPATRPDPFLPMSLQRERQLPRATARRQNDFAKTLTRDMLAASPATVASWPKRTEDRELRPSPLIATLAPCEANYLQDRANADGEGAAALETLTETHGPPLSCDETIRGGTGIFTDQSNCPFRAFAARRLKAEPLVAPEAGLDSLERGNLVHKVLETFWQHVKSRQALAKMTQSEQTQLITESVEQVVDAQRGKMPALFGKRFRSLEKRRLATLMEEWLPLELARDPFSVLDREKSIMASIDGHPVRMKMDRIDQLADDSLVLIDYKTGYVKPANWRPERDHRAPEPQLPVYASRFDEALGGVLFAQVKRHQYAWKGEQKAQPAIGAARVVDDWQAQMAEWRYMVESLSDSFRAGLAEVDPLTDACKYCHLAALCRVDELQQATDRRRARESERHD